MITMAYDKIKDKIIKGLNSPQYWNWPELTNYYGCFKLSTGIYLRCVLSVLITFTLVIYNCITIKYIFKNRYYATSTHETLVDYLKDLHGEEKYHSVVRFFDILIIYFIVWHMFQLVYIVRNIWMIYAVYKRKARCVRMLLTVAIPCWIFDGLVSLLIAATVWDNMSKLLSLLCYLSEGYNLLAINSKYKKMTGKSRKIHDYMTHPRFEQSYPSAIDPPLRTFGFSSHNRPHCSSCTCQRTIENNQEITNRNTSEASPPPYTEDTSRGTSNENEGKELNFKDGPIIYSQKLTNNGQTVIEDTPASIAGAANIDAVLARPNTLALRSTDEEVKVKEDLSDIPVIYDQCQLNIVGSPVIENR